MKRIQQFSLALVVPFMLGTGCVESDLDEGNPDDGVDDLETGSGGGGGPAAAWNAKFIDAMNRDHTGRVASDVDRLAALFSPTYISMQAKGDRIVPGDLTSPPASNFKGTGEIIYRYNAAIFSVAALTGLQLSELSHTVESDGMGGQLILSHQAWGALGWINNIVFDIAPSGVARWAWLDENIPHPSFDLGLSIPTTNVNVPLSLSPVLGDLADAEEVTALYAHDFGTRFADPAVTETLPERWSRLRDVCPDLTVSMESSYSMNDGAVVMTRQQWSGTSADGTACLETNDITYGIRRNRDEIKWAWVDYDVLQP